MFLVLCQFFKIIINAIADEIFYDPCNNGHDSGKNAAVKGYRVGGKSGTSQKLDSADEKARIASFVAAAPMDAPRLAVLVCLDEPHSWTTAGGSLSAPVAAAVLRESLEYLGVLPQNTD